MEWRTEVPAYWILVGANRQQHRLICDACVDAWPRLCRTPVYGRILWMEHGLDTVDALSDLKVYGHQIYGAAHIGLLLERIQHHL